MGFESVHVAGHRGKLELCSQIRPFARYHVDGLAREIYDGPAAKTPAHSIAEDSLVLIPVLPLTYHPWDPGTTCVYQTCQE